MRTPVSHRYWPWPLLAFLVATACDYDSDDFTPTETQLNTFLDLTTENGQSTLPADGVSRLRLIARISANADPDRRTITFTTSAGTLVGGTPGSNGAMTVQADSSGQATLELQSSTRVEDAIVRATATPGLTRQVMVGFVPVDADAVIRFTQSPANAPADGATLTSFTVAVSPQFPPGTMVEFTSTLGSFKPSATVAIDVDQRATVDLESVSEIGTAQITAKVSEFLVRTSMDLVRALPDAITVAAGSLTVTASGQVTITATLLRDVGEVTEDTVVTFRATHEDAGEVGSFQNVSRSTASGTATATFLPGASTPAGRVTITVGTNPLSATGTVDVEVTG